MLKYLIHYKFSILLLAFISLLSLIPSSSFPDSRLYGISFLDKIVHIGMYGSLGLTALLETRCKQNCLWKHLGLLLGIFSMSFIIEILQATCIASRGAEWYDLLANFLGLAGACIAYRLLRIFIS